MSHFIDRFRHGTVEKWLKSVAKAQSGPTFYELVNQKLEEKLQQKDYTADKLATRLLAIIRRKPRVVEIGTRISGYSGAATKREQLISDLEKDLKAGRSRVSGEEAKELAKYLVRVLPECVVCVLDNSPAESRDFLKSWLKKGGRRLGELAPKGRPVHWTTPVGFPVVQAEWIYPEKQIRSKIFKTFTYRDTNAKPIGIDRKAQMSAMTPQFVHSFDAAHMMLTINALRKQKLQHFAVVHDSYAVHACDVDKLNKSLRETFVSIYQRNVLEDFWEEQKRANDMLDLNRPPRFQGKLEIAKVRDSLYFFC